jgi:hypothetical protein
VSKLHRNGWKAGGKWVGFGKCCAMHRKKKRAVRRKPAKITAASPRYAPENNYQRLAVRISAVESMVNQLVAGQVPLNSQVYAAVEGARSVMQDLNTLKATILGHSTGWE